MIPALKSEFRKLLTVRSTYFIVGIGLLMITFFAGFTEGFRGDPMGMRHNPGLLVSESTNAIVFVGLIFAFAGLLLVGHEYRYNTVMYSLTSINQRYKVLLAKFITVTVFAVIISALVTFFSPFTTIVGAHLAGKHIGPQTFDVWSVLWRCVFCGWGYAMYAFILMFLLRNQVGAIVTFLLVPLVGENILGLLLKNNIKYLPFNALQSVPAPAGLGNHTTSGHAASIVLVYVVVGLLLSIILFSRRDAN